MTTDGGGAAEMPEARSDADREPEEPGSEEVTVRLIMPDRWLEHVEALPRDTTLAEAKHMGLRKLLLRDTDDPADFYVEYAEREVPDESLTLEELGVQSGEILSIRAYDLGHYPRFQG